MLLILDSPESRNLGHRPLPTPGALTVDVTIPVSGTVVPELSVDPSEDALVVTFEMKTSPLLYGVAPPSLADAPHTHPLRQNR